MANGTDNFGHYKVDDPVQVDVRWEDTEREIQDGQGGTIAIAAEVVVDQEVEIGSLFYLGTLLAYNALIAAEMAFYRYRAAQYKSIPDVKGRHPRRTLMLTKESKQLPESAS